MTPRHGLHAVAVILGTLSSMTALTLASMALTGGDGTPGVTEEGATEQVSTLAIPGFATAALDEPVNTYGSTEVWGSPWEGLDDALRAQVSEYVRARSEYEWYAGVIAEKERQAALAAQREAREARRSSGGSSRGSAPAQYGSGACGGDLPPCSVMMCESSGGNLRAQNPRSSASGKWQILDSTWAGYGGYARASDAPESVQDERARQVYAGGAGRGQWVC